MLDLRERFLWLTGGSIQVVMSFAGCCSRSRPPFASVSHSPARLRCCWRPPWDDRYAYANITFPVFGRSSSAYTMHVILEND